MVKLYGLSSVVHRRRMADPPRLTTTRCQMGRSERWSARQAQPAKRANLKRGQQHPWRESLGKRFGQQRILSDLLPCKLGSSRGRSAIQNNAYRQVSI